MTRQARGSFEVKITPQPPQEGVGDPGVGRLAIEKQFRGDLEGSSRGQMLAVGTAVDGSAGYVAMEWVSGSLHGRRGSFALQHSGSMHRGSPQLSVTIVPDSGTDALAGLAGTLDIKVANGEHHYELDYSLPDLP
ncbi:DUF3224 domain-containing protein [Dyella solisilvae]|uniref:DUF3224 domain-containing protein n=1 Tax=Dyella solisilvae TaxID=1920168 RepID=A0A370K912_9GAMM|nr:DUF3224 domain-containing protein [Dyella solisilvae]RDI99132.1 DUF3224 domain-containing protein [Dyella solisilvae]